MKYLKSLICKCLCINNLPLISRVSQLYKPIHKREMPKKFYSFKKTKEIYLSNKIYFDIYNDNDYCIEIDNDKYTKYNSLTAEHIFPQCYIKHNKESVYDMHNIYLTKSLTNSHRSNYKYGDQENYKENKYYFKSISLYPSPSFLNIYQNYKSNKYKIFIPNYHARGAIARSITYMKLTYNNINIENVIDKDTLIRWHKEHPPDEAEKKKNIKIREIQGNNNCFISNPEYLEIFLKKN